MKRKPKGVRHRDFLIESLRDPVFAVEYLNNAIAEGEPEYFLKALRNLVAATDTVATIAKKARLSRMTVYRALSENGNPEFTSLFDILRALKIQLTVKMA